VPSEEAFDIDSVPKEVKSQPFAEKKAPGKKPTGLAAPPSGPPSTADAYQRVLSSIPEFANFGNLFKVHTFDCFFTNLYLIFVPSMAKTI
jgi:coatomer protein complex subunit gamma